MKDDRSGRVAALANAEIFDSASVLDGIDGSPHIKHESLRRLYGELVVEVYDLAACAGTVPRVLDMGAGAGAATLPFLELGASVLAIDISDRQLAELKIRCAGYEERLETRCGEVLSAIGSMNDVFDIVVANSFLHHIPDYLTLIRRAITRLGPGGIFFSFQDPMRKDSLSSWHQLFSLVAYGTWRLSGTDVMGGIGRRIRRSFGIYRDNAIEDTTEYHAVRNGVDQHAIDALLKQEGFDCRVLCYFSTQSAVWQSIGERIGALNTFAIVAQRRQQLAGAEHVQS